MGENPSTTSIVTKLLLPTLASTNVTWSLASSASGYGEAVAYDDQAAYST